MKAGDKVRVSSRYYLMEEMNEMAGTICEVRSVHYNNRIAEVYTKDKEESWWFSISDLELIKEPKELKDIEQGDKIVDENGNKRMTLGKCGLVVFISFIDDFSVVAGSRTIEELERGGYSVYQEPEEEVVVEMTMKEVNAALGKNVKIKE